MPASLSASDPARVPAVPTRPAGPAVMRQRWIDLLFLHWEVPVDVILPTLPPGLEPDTFDGRAFLGIVPFRMDKVRPAFLPALPGVSYFPELNLRTYVRDRAGVPGVWFYSLDAGNRVAVAIARKFFHLPYHAARMEMRRGDRAGSISFSSRRRATGDESWFDWSPGAALPAPTAGSREH
ncbi:MAG: YqjF family protein, partial [Opitutaceae bacterium]